MSWELKLPMRLWLERGPAIVIVLPRCEERVVTFTDKRVGNTGDTDSASRCWLEEGAFAGNVRHREIPLAIFDRLAGDDGHKARWYNGEMLACADLSRAAIEWAEETANLFSPGSNLSTADSAEKFAQAGETPIIRRG